MRTTDGTAIPPRRGRQIPFRIAIVSVVVGLLVATCSALIGYVLYRGQRSVDILERDYLAQVAETTVRDVNQLPLATAQVLRVRRQDIEDGHYVIGDEIRLAGAFVNALHAHSDILWAGFSHDATGRFMGAHRLPGGAAILSVSDPRVNGGLPREFRADTLAPYVRTPPQIRPYEPRALDWYRRAVARPGTIVWTPPYVFAEGVRGVTAAVAVRDKSGKTLGVVAVDFALAGVESFLRTIAVERGGVVVVFDPSGAVLGGAGGPGREAATRAVESWRQAGGIGGSKVRQTRLLVAGEKWDVAARVIPDTPGLGWIVAAAVPDEAFMGPVYANRRAALVIALAGLGVAVVAGVLLANSIANPLGDVTLALDRIARFELEGSADPRTSRLREVTLLEDAVGRVSASLRSFSRYAPEEIVREVAESGREAMLSGERREVSALFSDLRGFTGFVERMPAEDVVALLNDHFKLLVGIITRHGGFVVDFLGDAIFAVFGAPTADADHAARAVACAIEAQLARAARNAEHRARGKPPMEMGVGIDTGSAVVGNMGSVDRIKYGVVGHVVNEAARIETLTVSGQVFVSDATWRALGDRLVADGPLEVEGKGLATAIRLWEVLALRGETTRVLPSPVRDLAPLSRPIDASVRLFLGKQLDRTTYAARVHRLGPGGAELASDAPLSVFAPLQVLLPTASEGDGVEALDGKVIALSERDGAPAALVRFTGLGWDVQARIEAFVRRGSSSLSA